MANGCNTWTALGCDIGKRRRNNEDYVVACEPADPDTRQRLGCIYIVADGIGGGAAGEVASHFAAHSVIHHFYAQSGTPPDRLTHAVSITNEALRKFGETHPRLATMGTTLVAASILGNRLDVVNVGDSRAYLIRGNRSQALTQDHNLAAHLAREGLLSPRQASHHPHRNVLLRSLGPDGDGTPDLISTSLEPGDTLLLCSDGLSRYVSEADVARLGKQTPPERAVDSFIQLANQKGGQDNIAVLVTRWSDEAETAPSGSGILAAPPPVPGIYQFFRYANSPALRQWISDMQLDTE